MSVSKPTHTSQRQITRQQIDELETLIGKLEGLHCEMSALSKKSPNDAVNKFKITFTNAVIAECNVFLGEQSKAIDGFLQFNVDDVPSNSDVTFVLSLYLQAIEKFRSDHIELMQGNWIYRTSDKDKIRTCPPAKLRK
jgi:hypothetical protein